MMSLQFINIRSYEMLHLWHATLDNINNFSTDKANYESKLSIQLFNDKDHERFTSAIMVNAFI